MAEQPTPHDRPGGDPARPHPHLPIVDAPPPDVRTPDPGSRRAAPSDGGLIATLAALAANVGVAAAKFLAFAVTGSASMLAEAVHSVADTANQALLLWGRARARQRASARHPFGYGRERYFWSFVVAMVLFSGGALFALVEGEEKLREPHELVSYPWAAAVLLVALVLEGASLRTAVRESRTQKRADERWTDFVRRTSVPELAVVLLEDSAALIGIVIALLGTTLAEVTGEPRFDALGSIAIGVLLAAVALTLAAEMKSMLIGESADASEVQAICDVVEADPRLGRILDLRTERLGPDELLVVGDVEVPLETGAAAEIDTAVAGAEEAIRRSVPAVRLVYLRARPVPERGRAHAARPPAG